MDNWVEREREREREREELFYFVLTWAAKITVTKKPMRAAATVTTELPREQTTTKGTSHRGINELQGY
jgi:hypothetical protein